MKRGVCKIIAVYAVFVLLFLLQRILFLSIYSGEINAGMSERFAALWHGLPMDLSVGGYITAGAGLLTVISFWVRPRWFLWVERCYYLIVTLIVVVALLLDLVLYGYWGFRLDNTPLFYFLSSPKSALASAEPEFIVLGLCIAGVFSWGIVKLLWKINDRLRPTGNNRIAGTIAVAILTGLLIIPIRGGVTVSVMNIGRAYFSSNVKLNHAAVNPVFSLINSFAKQDDFASQYRYSDDNERGRLFSELTAPASNPSDTLINLKTAKPDIYIIILESFSSHLFASLGGEDIAGELDSVARGGVLFTNFFANSFRTDRALPSILSGFPSQPSMSLIKYAELTDNLPSLPMELKRNGDNLKYFYGGDINYANFKSYLVNCGFEEIVSDKDFSLSQRTGKWGAHDGPLYTKVKEDVKKYSKDKRAPRLRVIQTSSSHEPFEVPYSSPRWRNQPKLNAFAYTDSVTGDFLRYLRSAPGWDNTVVLIVADHYGVWPEHLQNQIEAHRIPMILTGGAVKSSKRIKRAGVQSDIAATLLAQLGMDHSRFPFSKDLTDSISPDFAIFSPKGQVVMITPQDTAVYDTEGDKELHTPHDIHTRKLAQAWIQTLFDSIASLSVKKR